MNSFRSKNIHDLHITLIWMSRATAMALGGVNRLVGTMEQGQVVLIDEADGCVRRTVGVLLGRASRMTTLSR